MNKIICNHCRKEIDVDEPLGNNAYIKMLEKELEKCRIKELQKVE